MNGWKCSKCGMVTEVIKYVCDHCNFVLDDKTEMVEIINWREELLGNMKQFKHNQYTVNLCTDIEEWAKRFYDMPDGATIANVDEVSNECMGFANPDNNEIYIYVPSEYKVEDVYSTIAHEIGHCQQHIRNPRTFEQHEQKAVAYETFFNDVVQCSNLLFSYLVKNY